MSIPRPEDIIAGAVADQTRAVAEARERVVEAAIQSGGFGVRETWRDGTVTFELTADVPYGQIYIYDQ